jgi:hypothetical protein
MSSVGGAHIKALKEEIMEDITEKLMEKLQAMDNQKVQHALKKFKTPQMKNVRRYRNNQVNTERTSANTKVKQRRLQKKRYMK